MEKIKVSDYEAVSNAVSKYVEGCRTGKSGTMRAAFTENALMYGYLNGQLYNGSIDALYAAVDQFGPAPESQTRIDVLSIESTAATVRVILEGWHGIAFTDFHELLKIDGEWKIVAKVFHQY